MALDDCNPCDCDPAQFARTEQGFQLTTVRILCGILAASGGGGGGGGDVNLIEVGGSPVTLGQALSAASIPVVLPSDQIVEVIQQGALTESNPSVANATSVTLLAANAARKYLLVQNNSAANIQISLAGGVLTGIVPSTVNPGLVLIPGASYESSPTFAPTGAITVYQTSGGAIETVSVYEA